MSINQPLISVCIPTFNGKRYLSQCLDSVLGQSYQDFEIVIVDDCSSDGTIELVESYCREEARIKFIKNESNTGLVANWNNCITNSSGEWIKFIFQDDYMEKDCLEKFLKFRNESNSQEPVIVSKRKYISEGEFSKEESVYYEEKQNYFEQKNVRIKDNYVSPQEISNMAIRFMALNFIGEPTAIMFKRSIIEELGYFDEQMEQICDVEFALRIASRYGLIYIPYELTVFRIHEHSTTRRNISEKYYRLSCLEPVKYAHRILFDDLYKPLRKHLTYFNSLRLKLYFYVHAYEAYSKSLKNTTDRKDYQDTLENYPGMAGINENSVFLRICYSILRLRRKIS